VIEEETKLIFPEGFPGTGGNDGTHDPYSTLSKLWANRGGEEASGICVAWRNPNLPDPWVMVKPPNSRVPDAVPPRGTPDPSSEESEGLAIPHQNEVASRQGRRAKRKIDSLADDVYADTRYFGVSRKKGKLVRQGARTVELMGPLDKARFRDYRILQVDYYVYPMEGEKAPNEWKENDLEGVSPDGRPRRRRRKPRERIAGSKPLEDPPKRGSRSRVGRKYQATIPPLPLVQPYQPDMAFVPE
jgi:hypothetical protein